MFKIFLKINFLGHDSWWGKLKLRGGNPPFPRVLYETLPTNCSSILQTRQQRHCKTPTGRPLSGAGTPNDPDMAIEQLVLPSACQNAVLKVTHEIPLAGHIGKTKMTRQVLQRFYWPVYRDVAQFCPCGHCQNPQHVCSVHHLSHCQLCRSHSVG